MGWTSHCKALNSCLDIVNSTLCAACRLAACVWMMWESVECSLSRGISVTVAVLRVCALAFEWRQPLHDVVNCVLVNEILNQRH